MNFSFLTGPLIGVLGTVAIAAASTFLFKKIYDFIDTIRIKEQEKIQAEIDAIKEPSRRRAAQDIIIATGVNMPDADGNAKLDFAIREFQAVTPNWFISDDRVKYLIQSEYTKMRDFMRSFKAGNGTITPVVPITPVQSVSPQSESNPFNSN